jgi:hypothetical protein
VIGLKEFLELFKKLLAQVVYVPIVIRDFDRDDAIVLLCVIVVALFGFNNPDWFRIFGAWIDKRCRRRGSVCIGLDSRYRRDSCAK